jgi:hypothetical protein
VPLARLNTSTLRGSALAFELLEAAKRLDVLFPILRALESIIDSSSSVLQVDEMEHPYCMFSC